MAKQRTWFASAIILWFAFPFAVVASITTTGNVTPDPATTTASSNLEIGVSGDGTMQVDGGSGVLSSSGLIGVNSGSNGTATIDGLGSKWTNSGGLDVGSSAIGTLNVSAGGVVTASDFVIGASTGATVSRTSMAQDRSCRFLLTCLSATSQAVRSILPQVVWLQRPPPGLAQCRAPQVLRT